MRTKFQSNLYISLFCFICVYFSIADKTYAFTLTDSEIKTTAGLEERYDDNITGLKHDAIDDFITEASLGLDMLFKDKFQSLKIIGELRQQIFADNKSFNNLAEYLSFDFSKELSRDEDLTVKEEFRHYEEPKTFEDSFGRTGERYSYYVNKINVSYKKEFEREFILSPYWENEINNIAHSDTENSYLHRVGIEGNYMLTNSTYLFPLYDFSWRKFRHAGHENIHTILLKYRRYITKQFFIEGGGGWDAVEYLGGSHSIDPHFILKISNEIGPTSLVTLDYAKVNTLSPYTLDVFDAWRAQLELQQQLSQRLRGNLVGFYGEGSYDLLDIQGTTRGIEAAIYYDMRKDMEGIIKYKFLDESSSENTREYETYEITIGISAKL